MNIPQNLHERLESLTGLKFQEVNQTMSFDGISGSILLFRIGHLNLHFIVQYKKELDEKLLKSLIKKGSGVRHFVVCATSSLEMREKYREGRVGYLDDYDNIYLPWDVFAEGRSFEYQKNEVSTRANPVAEFVIGYLAFGEDGKIGSSVQDISENSGLSVGLIHKTLKNLKTNDLVMKRKNGYFLVNPRKFFDRWRLKVRDFQNKKRYRKFKTILISEDFLKTLSTFIVDGGEEASNYLFSGAAMESLSKEGHLRNAKGLSVYSSAATDRYLISKLKLQESVDGNIVLYESSLPKLGDRIAHKALIAAELINSSDRREIEAGEILRDRFFQFNFMGDYERHY